MCICLGTCSGVVLSTAARILSCLFSIFIHLRQSLSINPELTDTNSLARQHVLGIPSQHSKAGITGGML